MPGRRDRMGGVGLDIWPTGRYVSDYRIWEWDLDSGEVKRYMEGHANTPVQISINPDGKQALSAGLDGQAILWDLQTGAEIRRFEKQAQAYTGVVFHPDGKTALTSSMDSTLARWDLESRELLQRYSGHGTVIWRIALSPDGNTLYSTSWDYTLRTWDVATGELRATYKPSSDGCPYGLATSPDGKKLLVGRDFDWNLHDSYQRERDSPIAVLDAGTGETLFTLVGHTWAVDALAFSPDGSYALSGSGDQTVRLWDLTTGEQLAVFNGHAGEVRTVAFSPDGLTGYSTALDGTLRAWDLSEYVGSN